MHEDAGSQPVRCWSEAITIPTYPVGEPDRNPMFLSKRVYQGSSGVVYPHPVIDKIYDEKVDREYEAVFLENRYLKVMILPEIGGKIQMALDKTNDYHFVYYNRVIKPALVGLAGPWISGGIEFNWPQHHRPSTFDPVSFAFEEHDDGSRTVWVGEVERMFRTKGMAGFTLRPDTAYIEIEGRLYNGTPEPQTFLWWANPAVPVNDDYQSVFPPDVHAVMDHGKRDVSRFPIATGEYYKTDYSAGVDISWWKNIPVPTSYMAYHSDYDFVGGYDHGRKAGILHVADHHVSPGKKQWTWGNADFGEAWERNLTDEDGPYVELMTGVFTDNQPDFSWLEPYEHRTFSQWFMPFKGIGVVKNATIDAAVNLEVRDGKAEIGVYVTSPRANAEVLLTHGGETVFSKRLDLAPDAALTETVELPDSASPEQLHLVVAGSQGRVLVEYQPKAPRIEHTPDPAPAAPAPEQIKTLDELYLTGLHIEQYRHATREPADYYREALKRDPDDARANAALGMLLLRRGQFSEAERYLRQSVGRLTYRNPNPNTGQGHYGLALSLVMQGKDDEAFDLFHKACWNGASQAAAYFWLARIATKRGELRRALEFSDRALQREQLHHKARHLKAVALRKLGQTTEAVAELNTILNVDRLNFNALDEMVRVAESDVAADERDRVMRGDAQNDLELAIDYLHAGCYEEAIEVLQRGIERESDSAHAYPLLGYYLGYVHELAGRAGDAAECYDRASAMKPDLCFPHRNESILVLEAAMQARPNDARAPYYLGNLWYGKQQHEAAIEAWERSRELDPKFPTVHRNLGLAYFNQRNDHDTADAAYQKAFELDPTDARVLFELDQLQRRIGRPVAERLERLNQYPDVVNERDDLYLEKAALLNTLGRCDEALDLIRQRKFHPWEGGEGKVPGQYVFSIVQLGKQKIESGQAAEAIDLLKQALVWPHNLGEGQLPNATLNDVHYQIGCAYESLGDLEHAREHWELATRGDSEPTSALYYNDAPPELIFYQGLALRKLGREDEAKGRFNRLIDYGEKHLFDQVTIDYFAVSLPDFLIFEEDLQRRNELHCRLVMGLGHLGGGRHDRAVQELGRVLAIDPAHQGAVRHLHMAQAALGS